MSPYENKFYRSDAAYLKQELEQTAERLLGKQYGDLSPGEIRKLQKLLKQEASRSFNEEMRRLEDAAEHLNDDTGTIADFLGNSPHQKANEKPWDEQDVYANMKSDRAKEVYNRRVKEKKTENNREL